MLERSLVIYLISPQRWEASKVSKHHYARELSARGHKVFFLEPPDAKMRQRPMIAKEPYHGLKIVSYGTFFPYRLKFHARRIFNCLMQLQARMLVREIGVKPDIVWDFDNAYQFANLASFGASLSVFHPVDDLPTGYVSTKGADIVFSNAQRYLDRLTPPPQFARVIDHGLSDRFITYARSIIAEATAGSQPKKHAGPLMGYVGNLGRPGIDWSIIEKVAKRSPQARILMIGPYGNRDRGGPPTSALDRENLIFTGPKTSEEILALASEVDVWLMAYDRARDIDGGTNPHKLLEYLATGKVVVSNWVETYADKNLVIMPPTPENEPLPDLVATTLERLGEVNAPSRRARRAAYTLDFSYEAHLATIDALMEEARADKQAEIVRK